MVTDEEFNNALYTIDIGQNDLAGSFTYLSYTQVIEKIPSMITEIKNAIWVSLNFSISLPDHIVSVVLKNYNIFLTLDGFDFSLIQI